jgi:hypothetical protein
MAKTEDIGQFSSCMHPNEPHYFRKIKLEKSTKILRNVRD